MVGSARIAQLARRAAEFGVSNGDVSVDMKRVKARMDQVRGDSNRGVTAWLEGMDNLEIIRGHARFVGPNQIEVDGKSLHADKIFINVGARARVPDLPGLNEVPYFTNSTMLEVDFLPEHLVVIGGSYIGLEFAQMYRRFGSQVTVVKMADRLIPRNDEDVSAAVQEILENKGVQFELGAECLSLARRGTNIEVTSSCGDGPRSVTGTHLLLAVGRVPNTDDLGLEAAGVESNSQGLINVDDELRTSTEGVWALGEVNGRGAFTHTAYNDFEIVAANLFSEHSRRVSDRIECYGLFIDPPLGRVGLTEQAVIARPLALRRQGYRLASTSEVRTGRRPILSGAPSFLG